MDPRQLDVEPQTQTAVVGSFPAHTGSGGGVTTRPHRVITDHFCLLCFAPAETNGPDSRELCRQHKAELPLLCCACGDEPAVVWEGRWPVCLTKRCLAEVRGAM